MFRRFSWVHVWFLKGAHLFLQAPAVWNWSSPCLSRIHSVQIRVPHAKSATDAKKLERYARKTSRQTVNGVSVDKMPPPVFTLRPWRPWREVSSASVRINQATGTHAMDTAKSPSGRTPHQDWISFSCNSASPSAIRNTNHRLHRAGRSFFVATRISRIA